MPNPRELSNAEQRTTLAIMVFERTKDIDPKVEPEVAKMRAAAAQAVVDELTRLSQPDSSLVAVTGMARA